MNDETGEVEWNDYRPYLLVSSTSWTADEDFGILLRALEMFDEEVCRREEEAGDYGERFCGLVCVVTGKGPEKDMYERRIKRMTLKAVKIETRWLEAADYPILMGSADLGVCLHTSTSGVDLPMKVVDMFGCGVPVLAVGFEGLGELVVDGVNGRVFGDDKGLRDLLLELCNDGKEGQDKLLRLKEGVGRGKRWEQNWKETVLPIVQGLVNVRENHGRKEPYLRFLEWLIIAVFIRFLWICLYRGEEGKVWIAGFWF